jgi:hypothetical protein
MLNRWSIVVLLAGVLLGYAVAGPSVGAQSAGLPFVVGDTVTLGFGQDAAQPSFGSTVECVVAETRGDFVRCGRRERVGGGRTDRSERWFRMDYVVQVIKRED